MTLCIIYYDTLNKMHSNWTFNWRAKVGLFGLVSHLDGLQDHWDTQAWAPRQGRVHAQEHSYTHSQTHTDTHTHTVELGGVRMVEHLYTCINIYKYNKTLQLALIETDAWEVYIKSFTSSTLLNLLWCAEWTRGCCTEDKSSAYGAPALPTELPGAPKQCREP